MPNDALAQALQTSSSGFNTALQTIMQTTQNLQKAQYAKQQMAVELEQQKNLIDYRTDAQIRAQQKVYETTEKPQVQAQQLQDIQNNLREAYEEGWKTSEQRLTEFNEQYSSVANYNLLDVNPRPELNEETGQVQNKIYVNGEEKAYGEYRDRLNQAQEAASILDEARQLAKTGELATKGQEDGKFYLTQGNLDDMIVKIRKEPQYAQQFINSVMEQKVGVARVVEAEEAAGSGSGSGRKSDLGQYQLTLLERTGGVPVKEYGATGDISWAPTGNTEATTKIDFTSNSSIGQNLENIRSFFEQFEIDVDKIPFNNPEVAQKIKTGTRTGLSGEYDDYAKRIKWVRENDEESKKAIDDLFWYYENLPKMTMLYAKEEWEDPSASVGRFNDLQIDLSRLSSDDYSQLIYNKNQKEHAAAAIDTGRAFRQ